jgi:hypothetical protein
LLFIANLERMKPTPLRSCAFVASLLVVSACGWVQSPVEARLTGKHEPGGTRFFCEVSVSGTCNVVVYTQDCSVVGQDAANRVVTCTAKVHKRQAVKVGESVAVAGLPAEHQVCVRAKVEPASQFPSCVFLPSWVQQNEHAKVSQWEVASDR